MLFKFLYRNLKGYRLLVLLAIFMVGVQVFSDLFAALPIKFIPSKIQNPGSDPACTYPFLNGLLNWFNAFDRTPPAATQCPLSSPNPTLLTQHSTVGVIIFSVLLLIVFSTISALLTYGQLFFASRVAQNLTARLRKQLFEHLQRLSLDWHGKQKKGDLVQRITGNISDIEKFVTDGLVDLLGGILTLLGVAIIMYTISPSYTVLSLAVAPALFIIVLFYTKRIKAASKKAAKAAGQVADVATEDVNALTVIKVFTREEREDVRFGRYVGKNREASLRAGGLQAQFTPIVSILVALGTAVILGVGGYVAAGNTFHIVGPLTIDVTSGVDIGTLVFFLSLLSKLYQPMRDLSKLTNLASSAGSGAERIQEVLDQAPEVLDSGTPYYGPQKLRGDIQFDNVIFGYNKDRLILKGINLHIPAGKKVALVGLSGGGKTTLVKLIPRFYEITGGSLRIDGVDNRMYPLSVLRQNVSMVLQDSVLFEGSIRENIEVGKPGASDEEIIDAAKKAQMHETIMSLPDGYNTYVREQGKNFSGGQRQRLAIARAVLRDAHILILDEPTASLDVEAEAEVMHALDKLVVGRTVLMISHRLSTLGSVDDIIVLKDGRIVEQGTFKKLKQSGGVFAGLLEEQNRYNVERAAGESILRSAFAPAQFQAALNPYQVPASPVPAPPLRAQQPSFAQPVPPMPGRSTENDGYRTPAQVPVRNQKAQQNQGLHRARIVVEIDGKVVGERRLDKPELTIGRLSANDIPVPSQRVSRLHAKIRWENGAWVIEDAESLNGLVYQGRLVERHVLNNGDRINVAPTAVLYYLTNS